MDVFNTLTLKQIFWKMKTFLKKLEYRFLVESTKIGKNGVLPVTTLFFKKFCFSWRISYTELICCSNNPNDHICTFCKRWSFIWQCFFPVSILKNHNGNKAVQRFCALPVAIDLLIVFRNSITILEMFFYIFVWRRNKPTYQPKKRLRRFVFSSQKICLPYA